ncbi:MAG: Cellulosomal protein [Myxococcaceae bacterium]|nr:Cellulosomal protein [Myxococcaceae bacterium]
MNIKGMPRSIDPKWLLSRLESVSVNKVGGADAGKIAQDANDPKSKDAFLRGSEISKSLFASLQKANGETGDAVTLKNADGTLTRAGELFQQLDEARAGRDVWFNAPDPKALLYVDIRDTDLGYFRGNDAQGKPIKVTGTQTTELSIYWADPGPTHYVAPSREHGVLYYERGQTVDLQRTGNTSLNDPAASMRTRLDADGIKEAGGPETFKAKNLNRDPSTVRRALSADFFRDTLGVPTQRIAPVKWFANGWYQGLRNLEEPLDKTMWKTAVTTINPRREVPDDVWIFKAQWTDGFEAVGGGKLDKADLKYRKNAAGDDGGDQYKVKGDSDQTYDLATGKGNEPYGEFAKFVKKVNGIGLTDASGQAISDTDPARFNTDAYRQSVEGSMDVYEMLRAYTGLVLTGSWDNLINPSNFAWVGEKAKSGEVKWSALPVDLDGTWGIGWEGQPKWQDLDILLRSGPTENVPVIWRNLLANDQFKAYVLDYMEHLTRTEFTPEKIGAKAGALWERNKEAAYHESDTAHGPSHTQRPFSNDQMHKANEAGALIQQNGLYAPAITRYVEWRRASALAQIADVRRTFDKHAGVDFKRGQLEPK